MGGNLSKKARQQIDLSKKTGGTELNLSDCEISKLGGFKLIVKLKLLIKLDLSKNRLQTLPSSVSSLVSLEEFNLAFNDIASLPFEICQLSNLKILNLEGNQLTELPQPSLLGKLSGLREFNISANKIPNLPSDFAQLRNLTSLGYAANGLQRLPEQVYSLQNLKFLDLSGNAFPVPDQLSKLSKLEHLDMSQCKLSSVAGNISNLQSLTSLALSKNDLTGLPVELLKLSNLKILRCESNYITHLDDLNINGMKSLEEIYFAYNHLQRFAPGLGGCYRMRIIELNNNQIVKVSKEIGWLGKSLRKVNLSYNRIEDVPGEFTFLNRAMELDISHNPLTSPFIQWYENSIVTLLDNLVPFLKSYPMNCYAIGDAITKGVAGQPSEFTIVAKDYENRDRINGGDEFQVLYRGFNPQKPSEEVIQKAIVKDHGTGKYSVFYNFRICGKFDVEITDCGQPVKGSPWKAYIAPGLADPDRCHINRDGLANPRVGQQLSFVITVYDRFNNRHVDGGQAFECAISGPHNSNPRPLIEDLRDGSYRFSFAPGWAGRYNIDLSIKGNPLQGSPIELNVTG
eukprot:TRINITY_DN4906_c0_g1_i1.p1 TRINITY_DN4906_c0_g1~~TRINITY_DN4906_c0_g1_i1.p1  ORF type:complete len:570 (+),score=119.03 TRINITY_DN4906_c0_g1_i1:156-1865(+)